MIQLPAIFIHGIEAQKNSKSLQEVICAIRGSVTGTSEITRDDLNCIETILIDKCGGEGSGVEMSSSGIQHTANAFLNISLDKNEMKECWKATLIGDFISIRLDYARWSKGHYLSFRSIITLAEMISLCSFDIKLFLYQPGLQDLKIDSGEFLNSIKNLRGYQNSVFYE